VIKVARIQEFLRLFARSNLLKAARSSAIFKAVNWQLDSLVPWLVFSTFFVLCFVIIALVGSVSPPTVVKRPMAVFNTEAMLAALQHPNSKPTVISFTPTSAPAKAVIAHENSLNTPSKKVLYADYLVKWQNAVIASANAYIAKNGMPTGKVVVEVRVLPNGGIDSYHVLSSTNLAINPAITQILLRAAPYPKLPRQLANHLGIVIDRTWRFT
jgi:outer membrane biosynthesis protein TonB